jgi:hypothetical protein
VKPLIERSKDYLECPDNRATEEQLTLIQDLLNALLDAVDELEELHKMLDEHGL